MKRFVKASFIGLLTGVFFITTSFENKEAVTRYRCLVQMINYSGEGAYVIVSLIDPEGRYENTLYILGDDDQWYHEIDEWWSYFGKKKREVDGITGATLSGGARKVIAFDIEDAKMDKGYKIRFETSVEDQKYYPVDLEIPLTSEMPTTPLKGKGYIRYVRMMTQ